MTESVPLEAILRLCAAAAPVPWYPKNAAADLGLSDDDLAAFVEQLRGGGLIARTDAVAGYGRGYVLTPRGAQALRDPGDVEWLRSGQNPPRNSPPADGPPEAVPERERAVRLSLLAPFTAYVTYGLIAVTVAVFLWGVYLGHLQKIKPQAFLSMSPPDIGHATGAVRATDVLTPGWGFVRLLTCCFVHFGLIHLAANMLSLYMVGPLLERMWGHARFLVLYLIAGFGGSCAAMVLKPVDAGRVVSLAGASGAVWGIMASMAVWIVLNRRYMPRRLLATWGMNIVIVFVINIALTYQMSGFISAEAHYGGGAVGIVCALLLHLTRFGPLLMRLVATAAVAALPVFGIWAVAHPARFNPQWEAQAKALQKAKEDEEKERERADLQDRVMPAVKDREKEALKHAPDAPADPLINRNSGRRDEERVKQAIEAYGEAEAALRPATDLLRQAGPYHDADVEKARQVRLELIEARLDLFARNRRCLEAGKEWSRQEEDKREQAIKRVGDLEREWGNLLAR
jgi:membrane associated rhomboid family serine protease